ncbi:MAG: DDE transposase family protein [Rivularia sp. (in: cyanobacteria)]
MDKPQFWYIVKQPTGNCKIVSSETASGDDTEITQKWGPFSSQEEAITRRIGLIRTGKCQPM